MLPGAGVRALDAPTGATIWEYKRERRQRRAPKTLAIYDDMVFYTAPDSTIVALDARTGAVRWETKTAGGIDVRADRRRGQSDDAAAPAATTGTTCYIAAHDAKTGKELWKFYTAAGDDDPGGKTWGGAPEATRVASTWGLPGGYDPVTPADLLGHRQPDAEHARWRGTAATPTRSPTYAPADLYSNSTVALNPDTGKLVWYYQHLPGDDWDEDYTHERTLFRTAVSPDPKFVKWINPDIRRGQQRDVIVMVGEGGGIWALDRADGQFLWATPFPFDIAELPDLQHRRQDRQSRTQHRLMFTEPGQHHVICYWNTRSYWPTGVSSRPELAVRPVRRQLPGHDVGDPAKDGQPPCREARRHPARRASTSRTSAGLVKSTCRPAR